jgi:hypothetical protein
MILSRFFATKSQKSQRFTKSLLVLSAILVACLSSFSTDEYKLIKSIPFTGAKFTTDRLGNCYVIVENQILEFDTLGKPKANYSNLNSGNLFSVDASNPLKIVLFFPDFARLEVLDNKLALVSTIELRNLNIIQPLTVCQSVQDGYWIFDLQDMQLKKIDLNLQNQFESGNLGQLLGVSLFPNYISETDKNVFLNNPATGILVFDRYGSYLKQIPFTGLKSFQIIGNELLFIRDKKLMKYNLKTLEQNEVILPPHDSLLSARIEKQQLFLLTNSALNLYSY